MFSVIYTFETIPGKEADFEKAWEEMTELIYAHEGSLGSRLHKQSNQLYVAYAQWPDRETWEKSGDKLPPSSREISQKMKSSCNSIETLYTLDMVTDLLQATAKC